MPGYGCVTYGIVSMAAPNGTTRGLWITSDGGHLSLTLSDSAVREASRSTPDVLEHCKEPHL